MTLHEKIKVLVVDDSAFMRVAMRKMMEADARIEVIDTARNGEDALEKVRTLKPDLVTMDIEMPVMDGLTALGIIMKEMPLPVIMISSLTEEGADATFKALDLGAVDYIPKSGRSNIDLDIVKIAEQLRLKVVGIVTRQRSLALKKRWPASEKPAPDVPVKKKPPSLKRLDKRCDLVTLGVSTGGPMALQKVLPHIPATLSVGMIVVQHMPPAFTGPFARRLDQMCQITVKEAEDHDIVKPGHAYIARGGIHLKTGKNARNQLIVKLDPEPADLLFIPSINVMMQSAARTFSGTIMGIIMTGMGNDGQEGMRAIKEKNGLTLVQDEASCVIYGMPKACVDEGLVDQIVPLDKMATEIDAYTR